LLDDDESEISEEIISEEEESEPVSAIESEPVSAIEPEPVSAIEPEPALSEVEPSVKKQCIREQDEK